MYDFSTFLHMLPNNEQRDKWEEDYQVVGQGKDGKGKVLYAGNGLKPCIRWVVQNGDTYSKFMFKFH